MPHIHEKIDFTAGVFVVYNNKVLIRKHDKYGIWVTVGGHVELDETPDVAAVREVKEEVGLDVVLVSPRQSPSFDEMYAEVTPPWYMNMHSINDTHKHIDFVYFAVSNSDAVVPENATDEWKWFTAEELDLAKDINKTIIFYAKEALKVCEQK